MKRELKTEVLASSYYLPLILESENLLQQFVLNNSMNLFHQSNDFIYPERLSRLKNLSRTAQNNEISMQRDIDAAANLSWFDQCIKLLAQFCLAIGCALLLCIAFVIGVKVCGLFCKESCNSNKTSPVIVVDTVASQRNVTMT